MSESHLQRLPPNSRITVQERGDGIQFILPIHDFGANWHKLALGLIASGTATFSFYSAAGTFSAYSAVGIQGMIAPGVLDKPGVFYVTLFYASVFLTLLLIAIDMLRRRAIFTVSDGELVIRRKGLLWGRRWRWPRPQQRWITVFKGMQLIGVDSRRVLFPLEEVSDLSWIAQALQQALKLRPESDPAPGEIEVSLADDPNKIPQHGYLFARPGRLALRHDYLAGYQHAFFPASSLDVPTLGRMWLGQGRPVAASEIQCTIEEDGSACMQIIRVSWPTFWLTVWCEDKTAMQAALARFWGNQEEN
jgi:hypothetical protein